MTRNVTVTIVDNGDSGPFTLTFLDIADNVVKTITNVSKSQLVSGYVAEDIPVTANSVTITSNSSICSNSNRNVIFGDYYYSMFEGVGVNNI